MDTTSTTDAPAACNSPRRRHAPRSAGLAVLAVILLLGAGCASESPDGAEVDSPPTEQTSPATEDPTPSSSPSAAAREPRPEPDLSVTIRGDEVGPNAASLEATVGEALELEIQSDRSGELHVHSKPEQYVEFDAGRSSHELVIETPGVVEIEEHDTGAVVAQVQVGG